MAKAAKKKKKRESVTKAMAVERIDKMLPLVLQDVRQAIKFETVLETGNEAIKTLRGGADRGPNWYGAHCYNALRESVTLGLAIALAKLFDPGAKRMKPNKRDVASIPLLLRLARQKRCKDALALRARNWLPGGALASSNAATVRREIDAAQAVYAGLKRKHKGYGATLKGFRDKKLAHSLMDKTLKSLPRYEDLTILLEASMQIAAHLRLAIDGDNWTPEDFRREGRRQGRAFWNPAIKAVIDAENGR